MEIFAAGNKYKCFGKAPNMVHGCYYVFGWKWIKSKQEWNKEPKTYAIGPHYEEIKGE